MAGDAEVLASLVRALEAPAGNGRLDVEALQKFIRDTINPGEYEIAGLAIVSNTWWRNYRNGPRGGLREIAVPHGFRAKRNTELHCLNID